MSRPEAWFGRRQGIHVQGQLEIKPVEKFRQRRYRGGSPEHHQRRYGLLPVHGQLQREVETLDIDQIIICCMAKPALSELKSLSLQPLCGSDQSLG